MILLLFFTMGVLTISMLYFIPNTLGYFLNRRKNMNNKMLYGYKRYFNSDNYFFGLFAIIFPLMALLIITMIGMLTSMIFGLI